MTTIINVAGTNMIPLSKMNYATRRMANKLNAKCANLEANSNEFYMVVASELAPGTDYTHQLEIMTWREFDNLPSNTSRYPVIFS